MPNKRITELNPINSEAELATSDLLHTVDVSDTSMAPTGTNKRLTLDILKNWLLTFFQPGHTIQSDGVDLPAQQPNLNFTGNGVATTDDPANNATRVSITNANVINVGGGAGEVYKGSSGSDPITAEIRTLLSGDASVSFTTLTDTVDIRATGAGGGEVNDTQNAGTGGLSLRLPKNGVLLPLKSLGSANALLTVTDDVPNSRIDLTVVESAIDHQGISGAGSNPHSAIDSHISDSSIHYAAGTLAGAGLTVNANALDVGGGEGITVDAANVNATWGGDGAATTVARSDHGHTTNPIGTNGFVNNAVSNLKLSDMAGGTVKVREGVTGDPQDLRIDGLTVQASPTATTRLLAQENGSSTFVQVSADLLGGGSVVTSATDTVNGEIQIGGAGAKEIRGLAQSASGLPLLTKGVGNDPAFEAMSGANLTAASVPNAALADMTAETIKLRGFGTGAPTDSKISDLPADASPAAGHLLLAEAPGGLLRQIDVGNLPSGGGGSGDMLSPIAAIVPGELYTAIDTSGVQTQGAGFTGSDVARLSVNNDFAVAQTILADPSVLTVQNNAAGFAQVRLFNDGNVSGQRGSSIFQASGGINIVQLDDDGATALSTVITVDASANVDITTGILTTGGGANVAVTTQAATTAGTLLQGAAGTYGLENAFPAAAAVRTDVTKTIGDVGIDHTPRTHDINVQGATFAPGFTDNNFWHLINTGTPDSPVTITIPGVGESILQIVIDSTVGAVSFSAAPNLQAGNDAPSAYRVLVITRTGSRHVASWITA